MKLQRPLGAFVLDQQIGRGGFADVFAARHRETATAVAIKVLRRKVDAAATRQFRREVQAVAGLSHRGIVSIYDHGTVRGTDGLPDGAPWLAMRLARHGSLAGWLHRLEFSAVRWILGESLRALAHAHAAGVVHRDLKPANLLLHEDDDGIRLVVADFGLAHAISDRSETSPSYGTPYYIAPEQILGQWRDFGAWTDLYALGCVAYELCCGAPPFTGTDPGELYAAHLGSQRPAFTPRFDVPDGFDRWLRRLLARRIEDRFLHAADAAHALSSLPGTASAPMVAETRAGDVTLPTTRAVNDPISLGVHAEPSLLIDAEPTPPPESRGPAPPPFRFSDSPPSDERSTSFSDAGAALFGLRPIPFVGREQETGALWQALAAVIDEGEQRSVIVTGRSGTGKSRLVERFARHATERGYATVLRAGFAPTRGAGMGLQAMLRRAFRVHNLDEDELETRIRRVYERLKPTPAVPAGELGAIAAALRHTPLCSRSEATSRDARFAAARSLIERASSPGRPVIMWLDDAHWDAEAIDFARALDARHCLVILTVRDETLATDPEVAASVRDLQSHVRATLLSLQPLDESEHALLVDRLLPLDDTTRAALCQRTLGNPLFAVHVVGEWLERDQLTAGADGYSVEPDTASAIPSSFDALWLQRAARAMGVTGGVIDDRRIVPLEIAAVLGGSVDGMEWAAACAEAGAAVDDELVEDLVEARIATPQPAGWALVHALLRDALEISARRAGRWMELHAACARALGALRPHADRDERRGLHFAAAGDLGKAVPLLLAAAHHRLWTDDFPAATVLTTACREYLDTLHAPVDDPRRVSELLTRGYLAIKRGEYDAAQECAERAVSIAPPDDSDMLARAESLLGEVMYAKGEFRAAHTVIERALQRAQDAGYLEVEVDARYQLAITHLALGQLDDTARLLRAAIEMTQSPLFAGRCERGLAQVARLRGRHGEASAHLERARSHFEQAGSLVGLGQCSNAAAEIARAQDRLDEASELYRRARDQWRAAGSRFSLVAELNLAIVDVILQKPDVAERLQRVHAEVASAGQLALRPFVDAALAICHAGADAAAFDEQFGMLERAIAATEFVDEELADLATIAARRWSEAGDEARAERAHNVARQQRAALARRGKS